MKQFRTSFINRLPIIAVILIGVVYLVMPVFISRWGDDVYYSHTLQDYPDYWVYVVKHYTTHNGRLADLMSPFFLDTGVNRPLLFLLNASVFALMFYMLMRCSRLGADKPLGRLIVLAAGSFLPCWDFMWHEWITFINYVWPAALILAMLYLALQGDRRSGGWWRWALIPLCVAAGAMQEGLSALLLAGFPAMFILAPSMRRLSGARIGMIAGIFAGILILFLSPSYYILPPHRRIFPISELIMTSGWLMILLVAVTLFIAVTRRDLFRQLIDSSWTLYAVGSVASIAILIISGYPGRPVWFGELFAILALGQIISCCHVSIPRAWRSALCLLLFAAIAFHYCALLYWQYRMGSESRALISELEATKPRDVIYTDFLNDRDIPWYVLGKTHGVPDYDDWHYLSSLDFGYNDNHHLTILPTAVRGIAPCTLTKPVRVGEHFVSPRPFSKPVTFIDQYNHPYTLKRIGDRYYMQTEFSLPGDSTPLYLFSPFEFDPAQW